jgi:hypothetical protein
MSLSKLAYGVCLLFLAYAHLSFYPKWKKVQSEAAISWDVAGYYYYLPAIFIYNDLKKVAFHVELDKKYLYQDQDFYAAIPAPSGNMVMKYTAGMAVMYAPAFFVAHPLAKPLGFKADGFSPIYQFAISFWSLLWAFVGLWYLRKFLLKLNFSEYVISTILITYVFSTNYLEYAGISSPQTHSYIFTLYAILIFLTLRFYDGSGERGTGPSVKTAAQIGVCLGLAILARPTEILTILLPILWGVSDKSSLMERINFIKTHAPKYALTTAIILGLGSIQLIYFKYVSGHFIYNSYGGDVWMDWLRPHILDGLLSARRGWFVYTPIMLFSVGGFVSLYEQYRAYFWPIFVFFMLFIYISFGYNIWWYGGSLGQRQMIQIYPILAIPLAAYLTAIAQHTTRKIGFGLAAVLCIYLNFWLVWNAHREGGLWRDGATPAYLRRVYGRWHVPIDAQKLLDNRYDFQNSLCAFQMIHENNFEADSSQNIDYQNIISGKRSLFVDEAHASSVHYAVDPLSINGRKWLRATATFRTVNREWTDWKMPAFIVSFQNNGQAVKNFMLRPHRIIEQNGEQKTLWLDIRIPKKAFNHIEFWLENSGSKQKLIMDDVKIASFNE